ncbi:AraC family transcriptional regulator [Vallitalea guaymasensis]|uniref:AraC family transcriptional regulator n=1 Tax=Vallitalea guaymasensis TaxID=1185412 RepID=A0A8J8MB29_9FIRM|nr:AraC family transcriptional regulator [Vallitalea guaymasensis]QUH29701.1 AraC family transcriptional regulator [Vallitalea guaymasensis]
MNFLTFSKKKTYKNILLTLTISVVTTILFLASILYFNFERISLSIINNFIKDSLSQVSYSATFMKESAKTLAVQVSLDTDISQLLFYNSLDSNEITTGLKRINTYSKTAPFIHSIYLYDTKKKRFYSNIEGNTFISELDFFDKDIIRILNSDMDYDLDTPIFRKIPNPNITFTDNQIENVFTFLFCDYSNNKKNYRKAIILNISEDWIRRTINSLDMNPQSNTYIIDHTGTMIISNKNKEILSNVSNEKYVKKIIHSEKDSGYFIEVVDGKSCLVTYMSSDSFDWKFVQITPYNDIMSRLTGMKLKVMIISFIILLIGILSSLIISGKIYQPIDKMTEKLKKLEAEKRKSSYQLKQQFLINLLLGKVLTDPITLQMKFNQLKIKLTAENQILILLFRIDEFREFCNKYNASDRDLLKYAMMNITSEICSPHYMNECVNIRKDQIAVIFNITEGNSGINEKLTKLCKEIQSSIHKYLKVSVTGTISSSTESYDEISELYQDTLEYSKYRLFSGYNSIIITDEIKNKCLGKYVYPISKEKILLDALMANKLEKVNEIYMDIINSTYDYPYTVFESTITHLAYEINQAIECINQNSGYDIPYNLNTFIVKINKMEIIEDVNKYVLDTFNEIHEVLKNNLSNRYDDLLKKISDYITDNYMDKNLCLNYIATEVNMSPIYLGRLYKKLTSKSVAEHILEVRLENAKELLKSSNMSINNIIDKIGFVNAGSFYAAFKKAFGITPGQYRQNQRIT